MNPDEESVRLNTIHLLSDFREHTVQEMMNTLKVRLAEAQRGRLDVNLAKKYIEGKFGSMPVVDTEGLMDILQEIHKGTDNEKTKE